MILNKFTDVVVSKLSPRSSNTYEKALRKIYKLRKMVVFGILILTGLFALVIWLTAKPIDAFVVGIISVWLLAGVILTTLAYRDLSRKFKNKLTMFEQGEMVTGRVTEHRSRIVLPNSNSTVKSNRHSYEVVITLDHNEETVVLGYPVRTLQNNVPKDSKIVGLYHDGEYLFGESDSIKFLQ